MKKFITLVGGLICILVMEQPSKKRIVPNVINYNNQHYYYSPAQKSNCSGGCGGKCGGHCHGK